MASNDGRIDQRWFYGAVALLIAIVCYIWGAGGFDKISLSEPEETEISNPISPEP